MFGEGILGLMCFHNVTVEFITFTFVGVTLSPHFFIKNTHAASAPEIFHFHGDCYSQKTLN